MIALCRALNIPARFVTAYTRYEEPPPDFHAVAEVYLGHQWHLFDATALAPIADLIRIGTGRDALDVPFATFFGSARMTRMEPARGAGDRRRDAGVAADSGFGHHARADATAAPVLTRPLFDGLQPPTLFRFLEARILDLAQHAVESRQLSRRSKRPVSSTSGCSFPASNSAHISLP